jgi:hypothetical protein
VATHTEVTDKRYVCTIRAHLQDVPPLTNPAVKQFFMELLAVLGVDHSDRQALWDRYRWSGCVQIGTFSTGKDVTDWWRESATMMTEGSTIRLAGQCGFTTTTTLYHA